MLPTQTEAAECGLVCVAVSSALLGAELDMVTLRRLHPPSARGLTLKEVAEVAAAQGMMSRAVQCSLEELRQLTCPSILHWGMNHFVVLKRTSARGVTIFDPAVGKQRVSWPDASARYTGVALALSRAPAFKRRKERSPLRLWSLFRFTPALTGGLGQVLLLSLLLQTYVLASPFFMQLAIDEAALKGDLGLLGALAAGFGLFALFNVLADAIRGIALQRVSAVLGWDMTTRLF